MQKITPFLWFDDNLEEAMEFYISIFKDSSRIINARSGPDGKVMTATFEIDGQEFMALNGGPYFKFNEAVSFFVRCETQDEVDYYWDRLSVGGKPGQCGWIKDKFGLSWQIVPNVLGELMNNKNPEKMHKVIQTMLQMTKIDIKKLQAAAK